MVSGEVPVWQSCPSQLFSVSLKPLTTSLLWAVANCFSWFLTDQTRIYLDRFSWSPCGLVAAVISYRTLVWEDWDPRFVPWVARPFHECPSTPHPHTLGRGWLGFSRGGWIGSTSIHFSKTAVSVFICSIVDWVETASLGSSSHSLPDPWCGAGNGSFTHCPPWHVLWGWPVSTSMALIYFGFFESAVVRSYIISPWAATPVITFLMW